jgi:hypothetical protein
MKFEKLTIAQAEHFAREWNRHRPVQILVDKCFLELACDFANTILAEYSRILEAQQNEPKVKLTDG